MAIGKDKKIPCIKQEMFGPTKNQKKVMFCLPFQAFFLSFGVNLKGSLMAEVFLVLGGERDVFLLKRGREITTSISREKSMAYLSSYISQT